MPGAPEAIVNITRYSPDDRRVPVFVRADLPSWVSEMRGAARNGSTGATVTVSFWPGLRVLAESTVRNASARTFWLTTVVPTVLVALRRRVYVPRDTYSPAASRPFHVQPYVPAANDRS